MSKNLCCKIDVTQKYLRRGKCHTAITVTQGPEIVTLNNDTCDATRGNKHISMMLLKHNLKKHHANVFVPMYCVTCVNV